MLPWLTFNKQIKRAFLKKFWMYPWYLIIFLTSFFCQYCQWIRRVGFCLFLKYVQDILLFSCLTYWSKTANESKEFLCNAHDVLNFSMEILLFSCFTLRCHQSIKKDQMVLIKSVGSMCFTPGLLTFPQRQIKVGLWFLTILLVNFLIWCS